MAAEGGLIGRSTITGKICVVGFLVLSVRRRYAPVGWVRTGLWSGAVVQAVVQVVVVVVVVGGKGVVVVVVVVVVVLAVARRGGGGRQEQVSRSATGRRAHSSPAVEAM